MERNWLLSNMSIRIIPRLDIKGPNLIKSIQYEGLRVIGNPNNFAKKYYEEGADELFFQDAVASLYERNNLLDNLGQADITALVNFNLLNEYFIKNNLKVKKVVTQKFFLEKMGIIDRANNLSQKMSFKEQSNLYLRLKRLLDAKLMGNLFKVIFAYKSKKDNFLGFE